MEIVQAALSENPIGCIKFYGITTLRNIGGLVDPTLCLVFERATAGTLRDYIEVKGQSLGWYDFISLFATISEALERLHKKHIVHRYIPDNCRC
jgi:serine/threonine protein kinase